MLIFERKFRRSPQQGIRGYRVDGEGTFDGRAHPQGEAGPTLLHRLRAPAKEAATVTPKIPQTLSEALRLAADIEDQKLVLEAKVREDAPKVEFCDAVIKAHGDMLIREAAKTLGVRPTFLFDWLRSHDWITARNEPYSERVKQNVLRPRVSNFEHPEKGPTVSVTAHVTPKGLFRIYRSLLDEGLVTRNDQLEMSFNA